MNITLGVVVDRGGLTHGDDGAGYGACLCGWIGDETPPGQEEPALLLHLIFRLVSG